MTSFFSVIQTTLMPNLDEQIDQLTDAGVRGLEVYQEKLRQNARNSLRLLDLACEGRVALLFSRHSWQVTMRDAPDLALELDGETLYAEVKHFRRKEQDDLDEFRMSQATNELVRIHDVTETERKNAYAQIAEVARAKDDYQSIGGYPLILVIVSSTDCLELMVETGSASREYEAVCSAESYPRRLGAIMMINPSVSVRNGLSNIEFSLIDASVSPLREKHVHALEDIRLDLGSTRPK